MSKGFLITFVAGLFAVAAVIGSVFYFKKGSHLEPRGSVVKVRTQALDENHSLAVLEIRLVNDADVDMVVRQIGSDVETKEGHSYPGALVAASDASKIFEYYPALGERFNEPLMARDRIAGHHTEDRMLVFRYDVSEPDLAARKKLTVKIEDVTGPVVEFSQK